MNTADGDEPAPRPPRVRGLRGALANLVLLAVSSLVCLAALEALARYERYNRPGGKEQRERLAYMTADPVLGWRKVPGARATYARREFTHHVQMNSHGLHDREREYQAAPGTFRVLALGDSFVEAYQVAFDESVTQRLERSLSGACRAEVINAGTSGYSTDQEHLFYLEQGARYASQVVVLFFYYNDVLGNVRSASQVAVAQPAPPRPAPQQPVTIEGSAALAWVGERLERSRPRLYNTLAGFGLWEPISPRAIASEFYAYKREAPPTRPGWQVLMQEIDEAWDATERILAALAADVRGNGSRFVVAYIPSRIEMRSNDWERTVLRYGLNEERWDLDRPRRTVAEMGHRHGFPVLDLTEALRARVGWFAWPYYDHDGHWNSLGHAVAAAELESFLRREGWLDGCGARY